MNSEPLGGFIMKRRILRAALMPICTMSFCTVSMGQDFNPSYPRIYFSSFGKPPVEWLQKFDMVRCYSSYSKLKELNPNVIVTTSRDWNCWELPNENAPEEWYLRDSKGNKVRINYGYLMDMSEYCTPSPKYGGKKYNEYLITATIEQTLSNSVYDGFSCQGVWDHPYGTTDVDLDKNGINDWDEYGGEWLKTEWLKGVEKVAKAIYGEFEKKNKVLRLNSGRFHDFAWPYHNGLTLEHVGPMIAFDWVYGLYTKWMKAAPEPHLLTVGAEGESKNSFKDMRSLLAFTLLGDGYYGFTDKASGEHNYKHYYDEFDLNLGYPLASAKRLNNGCYVRFFDYGVSIVNLTGSDQVVTDADLREFASLYRGPYYRFRGGQDPGVNDGSMFNQVDLIGFAPNRWGQQGDGLVLLTEPKTVIADIIIDNHDGTTSPSNVTPIFTGDWMMTGSSGDHFFMMSYVPWKNIYKYAYIQPGNGSHTAQYKPNIGVAGNYEIFEWHGYIGDYPEQVQEATNLPFTIKFAGGATAQGTIDQSVLSGQWNSLGTYYLEKGSSSASVTISNKADGIVIADAFKFVWKGSETDQTKPNAPRDLKNIQRTEKSITLSWQPPLQASDGDVATAYQVFRNGLLISTPIANEYHDTGLQESTAYEYSVYTIDNAGLRSDGYAQATCTTLADSVPPELVSLTVLSETSLDLLFSEALEQVSAENIGNYNIEPGVDIYTAELQPGYTNVRLTTSNHIIKYPYTLYLNNIRDRSKASNEIFPNSYIEYTGGTGDTLFVNVSVDNDYEIWINGVYLGSGENWRFAESYAVPSIAGKNVIAIKAYDRGGEAGLVATIDFDGTRYVSNETWKVTTQEEEGWNTVGFNDVPWQKATSHGLHGTALPWANYANVEGIPSDGTVHWIWTADYIGDDLVFFRFTIGTGVDSTPPDPPTGVTVRNK